MKRLLLVLLLLIVTVSMCVNIPPEAEPFNNISNFTQENLSEMYLEIPGDGEIPRDVCEAKGMAGRVFAIHKRGCPACAIAVPLVEGLAKEMGKDMESLDVAEEGARVRVLDELKIVPYMVPTIIIDCTILVGVKEESVYRSLLERV